MKLYWFLFCIFILFIIPYGFATDCKENCEKSWEDYYTSEAAYKGNWGFGWESSYPCPSNDKGTSEPCYSNFFSCRDVCTSANWDSCVKICWDTGQDCCLNNLRLSIDALKKERCDPLPPCTVDKCKGVACPTVCGNIFTLYTGGSCDPATGSCKYTETPCENGCDSTSLSCKPAEDKCKNVKCEDKCESSKLSNAGKCNANTGECVYNETICPQGCAADGKGCKGEFNVELFYTDEKGGKVPIKFARVETWASNQGHILVRGNFITDENGKFSWKDSKAFAQGNLITGIVYFEDSKARLYVSEPSSVSTAMGGVFAEQVSSSDPNLVNFQVDFAGFKNRQIAGAAKLYALVQKAVEFKENVLKLTPTVKERVVSFSSDGNSHLGEAFGDQYPDDTGMRVLPTTSDFYNRYMADTIFHEYCHHIHHEVLPTKHLPAGSDHGGYASNPDSEYGLVEGWAEFCALEMKKYYNMDKYAQYRLRGTLINLELDYKMNDRLFRKDINYSSQMLEEMAIASLLVDLRDTTSDYGNHDDDFVSLPLSTIWKTFSTKHDFGDGKGLRNVYTLRDFYLALKEDTKDYVYLSELYKQGSSISNLDEIFVKHGAFQDLNSNGQWDPGEEAGYSGIGPGLRSDLEAEKGTEIALDIRDANGTKITKGVIIHVEVVFSGENSWLSYSYDVPLSEGKIAVPVPPLEYNATITMRAVQTGTTNQASQIFTTTTKEIYEKLDPTKPLGSYKATVSLSDSPACTKDYQCGYLEAGSLCNKGVCVSGNATSTPNPEPEPTPPSPEPDPTCCGTAFIFLLILGMVRYQPNKN